MKSFTFANPVWTMVPAAGDKCTLTQSSAESVLLGVWSGSRTKQVTGEVCAMMAMSNAYRQACRFSVAGMIDKTVFEKLNPGANGDFFLEGAQDLTLGQCADLIRPRLILDARMLNAR